VSRRSFDNGAEDLSLLSDEELEAILRGEDFSFLSDDELEAILAAHLRGCDEDFELIRTIVEATAAREGAIN
jgi:hypothetical protein